MNVYRVHFYARCPNNGARISYSLEINSSAMVMAEEILDEVEAIKEGFHEAIADRLHNRFGGHQKLEAEHNGVQITTVRTRG